jgi:beta-1,4-mannosyltransferase
MKVLIYPKAHGNSYHELLYGQLRKDYPNDRFTYLTATPWVIVGFPVVAAFKRLQGYRIFHLHWHAFYLDEKYHVLFSRQISLITTISSLLALKALGYKLVWTAHDALPHETNTSNDPLITRLTTKLASGLIVHSRKTIDELQELGASTKSAVIIPHGNYDGAYPSTMTRTQARTHLKIKRNQTMILFFGNIRPYKGIDDALLPAFVQLKDENVKLVIAGKCRDAKLEQEIDRYVRRHPNITFMNQNIPDEDVSMYFHAADLVCLPFKTITTSGSVVLAATFSKPIVAPRLGAIKDMPAAMGVLYDPSKRDALLQALRVALKKPADLRAMGKASRTYADTLSWGHIAKDTYGVYSK